MLMSQPETTADQHSAGIVRPNSLADDVYEAIFQRLISLKIEPGARITVDNLVREFNVSHTPIREALGRLEGEGLVVKTHLIGYRAAPQITRRQFDELYELRLLLEPHGAAKAALAMNQSKAAVLRKATVAMRGIDRSDEHLRYSTFARQDALFHDRIMEFAGNEVIRSTISFQHAHFHIFRLMFHERVTEEALEEHEAILSALADADGERARNAMKIHIERSRDRLIPAFK
ncbi:MAG: GntR family transcriptional regulator [Rhizobiaceae bacterium]|nr:GntR family transcriptional regulator [Rhizobiaceae bacterium]